MVNRRTFAKQLKQYAICRFSRVPLGKLPNTLANCSESDIGSRDNVMGEYPPIIGAIVGGEPPNSLCPFG